MSEPTPDRRPLWMVVALLLLGAVALWGASGVAWDASADRSGADVAPALVPLALLCLAAIAAAVATGGWVRRVLGAVMLLAGGTAASQALRDAGGDGSALGRTLVLAGALSVVAAGVLLLVRGPAMPRLGGGYRTPGAAGRSTDPERELWNALERGDDPTDRD